MPDFSPTSRTHPNAAFSRFPLRFEANQGQAGSDVLFISQGGGYSLYLTARGATLHWRPHNAQQAGSEASRLQWQLAGANPQPQVSGLGELSGKANYLTGNNPAGWIRNIPTYAQVHYREVYPGIDLVYYGKQHQLEYDFVVQPGADPAAIRLAFKGAASLTLDAQGDLVATVGRQTIRQHKPFIYQEIDGVRRAVEGGYLLTAGDQVGFRVGVYDLARPLIIDPVLVYTLLYGNTDNDLGEARGVGVGSDGSVYLTGSTSDNAYLVKVNPAGTDFTSYVFGGACSSDTPSALAVDSQDNVVIAGHTASNDFPVVNALQPNFGGAPGAVCDGLTTDGFLIKFDSAGSVLWATYLGGSQSEQVRSVAVDANDDVYMTGNTNSPGFASPIAGTLGGGDIFVAKVLADGIALSYLVRFGGFGNDFAFGIAVNASGSAYVSGSTFSADFPTTPGALDPMCGLNGNR